LGAVTKTMAANYNLFVNTITDNKIPVLLVVTHCENVDDDEAWIAENTKIYAANGIRVAQVLDCCFAQGGKLEPVYKDARVESVRMTWQAILTHASKEPVDFMVGRGVDGVLVRIRHFIELLAPQNLANYFNSETHRLLVKAGMSPDMASRIACPPIPK